MYLPFNEHEDAEKYISECTLGKGAFDKLRVIARYYLDEKYTDVAVREKLCEYVSRCGESFTLNIWSDMIDSAIKRAKKTDAILINNITVTEPELQAISKLKGIQTQRFAFTLLCLKKYFSSIRPESDGWICIPHSDLMKISNIKAPLNKQAELYRTLVSAGMIELPDKPSRVAIHVVMKDMNGKEEIRVNDFRNLGYQYMMYFGGPYFQCQECGLVVKQADNKSKGRPPKYCQSCAVKVKIRQSTESVMRKYYDDISQKSALLNPA